MTLLKSPFDLGDKQVWIRKRPFRQLDVMHPLFVLHQAKIVFVDIEVDFRDGVELGQELSDIRVFRCGIFV
jgi:hypothetical protein